MTVGSVLADWLLLLAVFLLAAWTTYRAGVNRGFREGFRQGVEVGDRHARSLVLPKCQRPHVGDFPVEV